MRTITGILGALVFLILLAILLMLPTSCAYSPRPEVRLAVANQHTTATLEVWQSTPLPDYGERATTATLTVRPDGAVESKVATARTKSTMGALIGAAFGFLTGLFAGGA